MFKNAYNKEKWQRIIPKLFFFGRKPIVGQDTVCIFCLTRCASKSPKLLTCLHSACDECFQERLQAAKKEKKSAESFTVDEDGCPIAEEVVVICPLCKVSSSEKEIVDNLFLTASEETDMEDDVPETHLCNVSFALISRNN